MSGPPFHPYGPSHLAVLAITVAVLVVICFWERTGRRRMARISECTLAVLLLLEWPANVLLTYFTGNLAVQWEVCIPGHLCDVAAVVGGIALLTRRPGLCELLYFWGLAGTLQGLLTPALDVDYPAPRFFSFFMLHSGVVIAALYIVLGAGITPRRDALWRCIGWLMVYGAAAGILDATLGTNYGFLRSKPIQGSLLDFLGPWPWYIGGLMLLAVVFFVLLDLPWGLRRWAQSRALTKRREGTGD